MELGSKLALAVIYPDVIRFFSLIKTHAAVE